MNKLARQTRVRNKLKLVSSRPRLCITKSNRYFFLQLIDDQQGVTLASAHEKKSAGKTRADKVKALAQSFAAELKKVKQTNIYVDRGSNRYHGLLAMLVEELRQAGINI